MNTRQKPLAAEAGNRITEGVIWKQLLLFFFPILLGTFFQQLYNAADAMIVGRFVGKEALSAVGGGTGTIIQVLVGFFVGLSSGATVVISQYYGAKRAEMVEYAVHTAVAFSLAAGALMMIAGIVAAPAVLEAMDTPADVLEPSIIYIRIYFAGLIGNLIYNMGSGILRAVGDSKRPLYFLIASCMTNIVLDLLFVVVFHMGVAGAAAATIISQALSAALVIWVLMRTKDMYRLELKKIRFDGRMFARIIRIGLPAGLQSIMYSLSNLMIQASVNALGTDTVAAWTAYSKIDSVYWMIINAFGIAATTFVGQNFGAGKKDRVRKGIRVCMGLSFGSTIILSFLLYTVGGSFYSLFTADAAVTEIGVEMLKFLAPFYFTYVSIEILSGALRGVGDCWVPMLMSCIGVCVLRILWIVAVVPLRRDIYNIMFSYPLTWTVTSVLFVLYYLLFSKMKVGKKRAYAG
nr:MATE family efflux transporter [uncultured Acetatifactor sp.]